MISGKHNFNHWTRRLSIYLGSRARPDRLLPSSCAVLPGQSSWRESSLVRWPSRGNKDWPKVSIFAQRKKDRPNKIGVSICELLEVNGLAQKSKLSTPATALRSSTSSPMWKSSTRNQTKSDSLHGWPNSWTITTP